jgi:protease II
MRDTSDPDLAALLEAENAYADAFVDSAGEGGGGLRARLAAEMRARLPPSAASPPQPWGPWFVLLHSVWYCSLVTHALCGLELYRRYT